MSELCRLRFVAQALAVSHTRLAYATVNATIYGQQLGISSSMLVTSSRLANDHFIHQHHLDLLNHEELHCRQSEITISTNANDNNSKPISRLP
jgi:hypothetical protein